MDISNLQDKLYRYLEARVVPLHRLVSPHKACYLRGVREVLRGVSLSHGIVATIKIDILARSLNRYPGVLNRGCCLAFGEVSSLFHLFRCLIGCNRKVVLGGERRGSMGRGRYRVLNNAPFRCYNDLFMITS